jgi:hypothetical protein
MSARFPPLAGVCTHEEAARPGLSVEQTVARLRWCNHLLRRLHEIAAAHLPGAPEWELKAALGLHLWLDAEHAGAIRARVAQMREPPLQLDVVPDGALEAACDEVLRAEGSDELVAGVYGVLRPALVAALRGHVEALNPIFDHPTLRLLRTILREQEEILEWGAVALTAVDAERFAARVRARLAGDLPPSRTPYEPDFRPRRDERFHDGLNNSGKVGRRLRDPSLPVDERGFALVYKRLLEMDVPEMMAPILWGAEGRPWEFRADLARQLWDETRHALMGEVALEALGIPFHRYPLDYKFSEILNTQFTPLEAHMILWKIEQGLMPRTTGKRFEWELATRAGDELTVAMQDYDWADEVLHAQIGRRWLDREQRAEADAVWARYLAVVDAWAAEHADDEPWWDSFLAEARAAR